jgi:hypothetical protein
VLERTTWKLVLEKVTAEARRGEALGRQYRQSWRRSVNVRGALACLNQLGVKPGDEGNDIDLHPDWLG